MSIVTTVLFSAVVVGILYQNFLTAEGQIIQCEKEREPGRLSRHCPRTCIDDRDCAREGKRCLCDGICGRSCVDPYAPCLPTPSDIEHGKVELTDNRFGAVVKYRCEAGYKLIGVSPRVCQGDQRWMGEPPRCELDHGVLANNAVCGEPPRVDNAYHDGPRGQIRYSTGTNLRYRCMPGYVQRQNFVDRAWCVGNGDWVGPNMTCSASGCPKPPDIPFGYVEMQQVHNIMGSKVRYRCQQGYFLVGNEERTCLKDGTWDKSEPSCSEVVCGPPQHVEHAHHDAPDSRYHFEKGTQLMYSCEFGYFRDGSPRAICTGPDGEWSGPNMTCKARSCDNPGEIDNGWRDPGYSFQYPTSVGYHCNEGYELEGSTNTRKCLANGDWSGQIPRCEPIHCPGLGPPLHGTMIGSDTAYGTVIRFVCNNGYRVVGSPERSCQADRTWSGRDAFCEEIDCGVPGPFYNGYLDGHRTTVGAIMFFRCEKQTTFNGTSRSANCLENGQWSHPVPQCLGKCKIPAIENGTISNGREGLWVDHGTIIQLKCLHGLELDDSRPVTCFNGTWSHIPKCVPAPCDSPPPQLDNGHRVFFDLAHGSRARYFCFAGYKLAGDTRYMTCEFGQWVGARPVCEENYCPNPGNLRDGHIFKVGSHGKFHFSDYIVTIRHGERLLYECKRNYKLVGPRGAACVNGKWSPSEKPSCVRSRHPLFNKLWQPYEERARGSMYY